MQQEYLFLFYIYLKFTDDIRDYRDDKKNRNANLLISMEKEDKKNSKNKFIEWYLNDEKLMLKEVKKAGLVIDNELITVIPWYPLFMK